MGCYIGGEFIENICDMHDERCTGSRFDIEHTINDLIAKMYDYDLEYVDESDTCIRFAYMNGDGFKSFRSWDDVDEYINKKGK